MIESAFYHSRPNLKRIKLKKFLTAEQVAPLFGISTLSLLNLAAEGERIHGVLLPDKTVILHPEGVFKEIGKIGRAFTKKLSVPSHSLRRILKNRQKENLQ